MKSLKTRQDRLTDKRAALAAESKIKKEELAALIQQIRAAGFQPESLDAELAQAETALIEAMDRFEEELRRAEIACDIKLPEEREKKMKMSVVASDFLDALSVVGSVTPKPITPNGISGFLLKVEENKCRIYSRDTYHISKVSVDVEEAEDGSAIYPASNVAALKFLGDQKITLRSFFEDGAHLLEVVSTEGASSKKVTVDPDLYLSSDEEVAHATEGESFPVGVLNHILNTVKPFCADAKDTKSEDHLKTVQIFDASHKEGDKLVYKDGDGYAYAANGTISCSAYCEVLKGKSLALQIQHLPGLLAFLSKVEGNVTVKHGPNMEIFETEKGDLYGYSKHHKVHPTFRIYEMEKDGYAFRVPRKLFLDALGYARAEMDPKENKVRLSYNKSGGRGSPEIRVSVEAAKNSIETFAIPVAPLTEDGVTKDGDRSWSLAMNIDYLTLLLTGLQAHEAEFRVSLIERRQRTFGMVRTVDRYRVDDAGKVSPTGSQCTVIRWSPSKETD